MKEFYKNPTELVESNQQQMGKSLVDFKIKRKTDPKSRDKPYNVQNNSNFLDNRKLIPSDTSIPIKNESMGHTVVKKLDNRNIKSPNRGVTNSKTADQTTYRQKFIAQSKRAYVSKKRDQGQSDFRN